MAPKVEPNIYFCRLWKLGKDELFIFSSINLFLVLNSIRTLAGKGIMDHGSIRTVMM